MRRMAIVMGFLFSMFLMLLLSSPVIAAPRDGAFENLPKEQVFGAEIQYFRLRGGYGPNVPRTTVIALWEKALDAAKEAKMNMVSFYIPWDFHEYAPGKFDFDGTADEDGDGHADYPSRDVKTWIKMVEERGFKYVMARPGPYINAEWGFLGFGAIPQWFHEKYPNSHMRNPKGYRTKLYDYHNPDLLRHTQLWFNRLHADVLAPYLGNLIRFMQVDNETNFLWQSIHNHDFGPRAKARYRRYLAKRYGELSNVNTKHGRRWQSWKQVQPPAVFGQNTAEDQDWYRFQDLSIHSYLKKVRQMWHNLGVRQPKVIFTLAESYNAQPNGLLPNPWLRNDPKAGLGTVNLYPKTSETPASPFLNNPFKADHDVMAQESASELYLGRGKKWVMGPEIQGGWWRGIPVSWQARQQTYLTTLGHGMKALLVYYFNEGQNWGVEWAQNQIKPYFNKLKSLPRYSHFNKENLPDTFWKELQETFDRHEIAGFDVKTEVFRDLVVDNELFFDAPLDGNANPRPQFEHLKKIGESLTAPFAAWLGKAESVYDPVCLVKDVAAHVPTRTAGLDNVAVNADWASALIGYGLNSGVNMRIHHWGINSPTELESCRVLFHQDLGHASKDLSRYLGKLMRRGHVVVNLLDDSLSRQMGVRVAKINVSTEAAVKMHFGFEPSGFESKATFRYDLKNQAKCLPVLAAGPDTYGYRCKVGKGSLYQLGSGFYSFMNANEYSTTMDLMERTVFLKHLLKQEGIEPRVQIRDEVARSSSHVVAFARQVSGQPQMWITVKSGQHLPTQVRVQVAGLNSSSKYRVRHLITGVEKVWDGATVTGQGFPIELDPLGSEVYWIEPTSGVSPAGLTQ